jgi:hypothetical protein
MTLLPSPDRETKRRGWMFADMVEPGKKLACAWGSEADAVYDYL